MARPGGDSIAVLLPVPNLRGRVDWAREADGLRDALVADLERTFGLEGLGDSVVVEHRMTPLDFRDELGAVDGNAFSVEPTLHQSAWFRLPNRDPAVRGALPRRRRDASGRGHARRAARRRGHGRPRRPGPPRPAGTLGGRRRAAATA